MPLIVRTTFQQDKNPQRVKIRLLLHNFYKMAWRMEIVRGVLQFRGKWWKKAQENW